MGSSYFTKSLSNRGVHSNLITPNYCSVDMIRTSIEILDLIQNEKNTRGQSISQDHELL